MGRQADNAGIYSSCRELKDSRRTYVARNKEMNNNSACVAGDLRPMFSCSNANCVQLCGYHIIYILAADFQDRTHLQPNRSQTKRYCVGQTSKQPADKRPKLSTSTVVAASGGDALCNYLSVRFEMTVKKLKSPTINSIAPASRLRGLQLWST